MNEFDHFRVSSLAEFQSMVSAQSRSNRSPAEPIPNVFSSNNSRSTGQFQSVRLNKIQWQYRYVSFHAKSIEDAFGTSVAHLNGKLAGLHRSQQVYVSNRLCDEVYGLLDCRFLNHNNDDDGDVQLLFDIHRTTRFDLLSAMASLGYQMLTERNEQDGKTSNDVVQLRIDGMHCNSCVSNICAAVEDLPGSIDVQLTFEEKVATVIFDAKILIVPSIIEEIEKLGFKVAIVSTTIELTEG
jgi:copper chaperone CopZ